LQEAILALIASAPEIIRELVKPAEKITEMKVLQLGGFQSGGPSNTDGGLSPMLGNALGPLAKTLLDTSALMPVVKELMKFADSKSIADLIPAMGASER